MENSKQKGSFQKKQNNFKNNKFVKPAEKVIEKPKKECIQCKGNGKYKCSKCFLFYCGVECYKTHQDSCIPKKKKKPKVIQEIVLNSSEDCVEENRLIKVHIFNFKN